MRKKTEWDIQQADCASSLPDITPPLPCNKCGHPTAHRVLASHTDETDSWDGDRLTGSTATSWTISRCETCGEIAYLTRHNNGIDESLVACPLEYWEGHKAAWNWTVCAEDGPYKTGPNEPHPIWRLMAWNIRHGGGKRATDILARIARHRADIVVLSEFRNDRTGIVLNIKLQEMGFLYTHTLEAPEKANSVLIASRDHVELARPLNPGLEKPHMLLDAEVLGISLVGVYMPNNNAKTPYWEAVVGAAKDRADKPCMFVGDFNTGKHYIDEPSATLVSAPFMDRMEAVGFADLWRGRNPDGKEFTWISNAGNGFRLDHAFASPSLAERVVDVFYSHAERLDGISDHSALIVDIRKW
ncbi:Endonuclease/exonuclease/phosphatase (modular protein) [Rhodospirillaceae bacterium LM-1]|nr:Endonuclease/exonuclease/phosphatase (modular protein) [Rhodospirillaceae bacterium LM-1]